MTDYRAIIQNVIDTVEQISVRGSKDGQRIYTIVYALQAMQNEMTAEMETERMKMVAMAGKNAESCTAADVGAEE